MFVEENTVDSVENDEDAGEKSVVIGVGEGVGAKVVGIGVGDGVGDGVGNIVVLPPPCLFYIFFKKHELIQIYLKLKIK